MSNIIYLVHTIILLLLQLVVFDNMQLNAYIYINIYVLIIYILPNASRNIITLIWGFLLGFIIDLANNTVGIHAIASTLLTYLRPYLLSLLLNREQIDNQERKQKINETKYFFKYVLINTTIFHVVLIICEAFSFQNFLIILLRVFYSTLISVLFIMLYYFIALKKDKLK